MQFNFGTLINSILVAIIIFYVYFYPKIKSAKGHDRRKEAVLPKNPGVKPGDGTACKENRDKLVKLEEKVGNVEKNIREIKRNNRDDHKSMFDKIEKIKNNRR